ncbi:FAD-binding oxidoreductase [Schaalia sp. ZJ405]|uniref:FAD-binding oxidoreductase n=1 Tax=unclassified Schaalia TaxID=2691889 RepID=UPI0013ECF26E|nr:MULTISPECIES: FAD-binding oxidoreductase [unclassified Schaalia]QPK81463.1 FAD-binding oxidoreductase [Schaalia sp. ZJ405]
MTDEHDARHAQTIEALTQIVGAGNVDTDLVTRQKSSVDRFKKYSSLHGIYEGPLPIAVVTAHSTEEISQILSWCNDHDITVIPRTGRTSTEGGLEVVADNTIVLDGSAMNTIVSIDPVNMQATAQCGVPLQVLEDECRKQGLTIGHSPQSKPVAQMGGLVSTRSIGQLSTLYGAIEDMVTGLEAVFPDGTITRIKDVPRRAAGPDIRHVIIGNEGTLCYITEVTVKLHKYTPETTRFAGFLIDDMADGLGVLRTVITDGYHPAVCRVYSPEDARQHWEWYNGKCVLVFSAEGPAPIADATIAHATEVAQAAGAEAVDPTLIETWFANLNWGLDKIEAEKQWMRDHANLGYTTEISGNWSVVADIYRSTIARIREEFPRAQDLTMLGAHSSHSYQTGTNLYFVYDYNINCEPADEINEYHIPLNAIIVEEALKHGGSMVHHHGIGKYRTPWTREEHGSAFYLLEGLKKQFDPKNTMNPGSIYPLDSAK